MGLTRYFLVIFQPTRCGTGDLYLLRPFFFLSLRFGQLFSAEPEIISTLGKKNKNKNKNKVNVAFLP